MILPIALILVSLLLLMFLLMHRMFFNLVYSLLPEPDACPGQQTVAGIKRIVIIATFFHSYHYLLVTITILLFTYKICISLLYKIRYNN
jgi:hypothetical protein